MLRDYDAVYEVSGGQWRELQVYHNDGGRWEIALASAPITLAPVALPSDPLRSGGIIRAVPGDYTGEPDAVVTYAWTKNGEPLNGVSGPEVTDTAGSAGAVYTVTETATNDHGAVSTSASMTLLHEIEIVTPPVLAGTSQGQALSAALTSGEYRATSDRLVVESVQFSVHGGAYGPDRIATAADETTVELGDLRAQITLTSDGAASRVIDLAGGQIVVLRVEAGTASGWFGEQRIIAVNPANTAETVDLGLQTAPYDLPATVAPDWTIFGLVVGSFARVADVSDGVAVLVSNITDGQIAFIVDGSTYSVSAAAIETGFANITPPTITREGGVLTYAPGLWVGRSGGQVAVQWTGTGTADGNTFTPDGAGQTITVTETLDGVTRSATYEFTTEARMADLVAAGRVPIWLQAADAVVDGGGALTVANRGFGQVAFDLSASAAEAPAVTDGALVFTGSERVALATQANLQGVRTLVAASLDTGVSGSQSLLGLTNGDVQPTLWLDNNGHLNVNGSGAGGGGSERFQSDYRTGAPALIELSAAGGVIRSWLNGVEQSGAQTGPDADRWELIPAELIGNHERTGYDRMHGRVYAMVSVLADATAEEVQIIRDHLAATTPAPQL